MDAKEKWSSLDSGQRELLLNEYRYVNTCDPYWSDSVGECFGEDMRKIGVHYGRMYYSGFSSQGDGACFAGNIDDWEKFLAAVGRPELIGQSKHLDLVFKWTHSGRYCHEHSINFDENALWIDNPFSDQTDLLRYIAWQNTQPNGGPFHALADDFRKFLRSKMRELYHRLEEEYDYLTSDETVIDYITDNHEDKLDEILETSQEEA